MKQRKIATIDAALELMRQNFAPNRCEQLRASVHWRLTGSEPREFTIQIQNGELQLSEGPTARADAVMETTTETYLRLANGELSGSRALLLGQLRIQGSLTLAGRVGRAFRSDPRE